MIKVNVASTEFNKILVDLRSSMDSLFKSTLYEMGITYLRLKHIRTSLKGFGQGRLTHHMVVELPVIIGARLFERTMVLDFVVVEDSLYQKIFNRPFLRTSRAVMSNHYLTLKYRVNGMVGVVKGNQKITRGCYTIATRETMQIISMETRGDSKKGRQKPIKEVESVKIKQDDPMKIVKIESKLGKKLKTRLVECFWAHVHE